jgi:hypothetical protein
MMLITLTSKRLPYDVTGNSPTHGIVFLLVTQLPEFGLCCTCPVVVIAEPSERFRLLLSLGWLGLCCYEVLLFVFVGLHSVIAYGNVSSIT